MVNIGLMILASVPLYFITPSYETWVGSLVLCFFVYNVIFRKRCLGMRWVRSYIEPPASIPYIAAYTAGFASCLISLRYPFDLLAGYATANIASVAITGNTFHGAITGSSTMTRDEYIALKKRECLELCDDGQYRAAVASMMIAMSKVGNDAGSVLNCIAIEAAAEGMDECVRSFIEGFE